MFMLPFWADKGLRSMIVDIILDLPLMTNKRNESNFCITTTSLLHDDVLE